MRVSHVHHTLEETSFLGTTVVEKDQRVLNRHNAVINALKNEMLVSESNTMQLRERNTYIQQQQSAVRLVHDTRLDEREFLLGILLKLLGGGVTILLGPAVGDTTSHISPVHLNPINSVLSSQTQE